MIHLVDSDTFIFLLRGLKLVSPASERERERRGLAERILQKCQAAQRAGDGVGLSAITIAELEFGARRSTAYETEMHAVRKTLAPFDLFPFDPITGARHYGEIRFELEAVGKPIGRMNLLIAAHARALGAAPITNNETDFSRVSGLRLANWSRG